MAGLIELFLGVNLAVLPFALFMRRRELAEPEMMPCGNCCHDHYPVYGHYRYRAGACAERCGCGTFRRELCRWPA